MERLGESSAFGLEILEILGRNGWDVARTTAFAGAAIDENDEPVAGDHAAVLVIAEKGGYTVSETGDTLNAVALRVLEKVAHRQRLSFAGDLQLQLA